MAADQFPHRQKWPRVAIVGCGYWGRNLVRNYAQLGQFEALADHHPENVASLIGQYGGRAAVFDEILNDASIGAVVVSTPASSHFELGLAALKAGKHVFIEKPLALSSAQAEKLRRLALEKKLVLMAGHVLRYHAAFVRLLDMARAGTFGRIRHISSTRFNMGKILDEENVIWSLAPHDASMVAALLGSNPVEVEARGDDFLRRGILDMASLRFVYASGVSAEIRVSWMNPVKENRLVVIGDKAMAIFDDTLEWNAKLSIHRPQLDWSDPAVIPLQGQLEKIPLEPMEPLRAECLHFLDCVATGAQPITDGEEALAVVGLLERASASFAKPESRSAAGTGR